jgi:glycogen debranching enzyme
VNEPSVEILYGAGVALACGHDGEIRADDLHGLFAADCRVLSTYRLALGGLPWQLLSRIRQGHGTARWTYQNQTMRQPRGDLPAGSVFLELRRRLAGALHDDLRICQFTGAPLHVRLVLLLDADFSDIFEVKSRQLPPRVAIRRTITHDGVTYSYTRGGFHRGLRVTASCGDCELQIAGSQITFEVDLEHATPWTCCLDAVPEVDHVALEFEGDPHDDESIDPPQVEIEADGLLRRAFERGCSDLSALAVPQDGAPPFVAAGVPWFQTLFGRDSTVTSIMTGLLGTELSRGTLVAVGRHQARHRDDWRDAEPGKLPHELRRGELASRNLIPHTPYYATHDTPSLFCLTLWNAWRWTGDRELLDAHLDTARRALAWCDEYGDRDGDGLQEYGTRSRLGYYNQSWKDAGDAILHEDGRLAELPIATVELQGYLYAARLALAELLDVTNEHEEASALRAAAATLRTQVDTSFWLDSEGTYALALDGHKAPVVSATSNPGHLLWCGMPAPDRAAGVVRRLLAHDLDSGWGVRTLSSMHRCYNPLSYQRGSVWPHDTMLAAAGMWRYGYRDEGSSLIRAVLDAARAFESDRLPELYCGFGRELGPPVPYAEANSPQAWAAAAPILAVQLFLGIVPDAPHGRCWIDPWLPEWLPELHVRGLPILGERIDVHIRRHDGDTAIEDIDARQVHVQPGTVAAPLWGVPIASATVTSH